MPREQRVGSTPTSPTPVRSAPSGPRRTVRGPPPILPGDADHHDPRPQVHRRARDRAARRSASTGRSTTPSAASRAGPASPASGRARPRDRSSSARSGPGPSSTRRSSTSSRTPTARPSSSRTILPLTNADVEVVQAEEGKPLIFKATVQVRPEVKLGDYQDFNFAPEIETIDDARVDKVIEELRDQNATLDRGRGPRRQGRRLRGHRVRRDARRRAVRGRHARSGCR